ncbi:glycosyltransferase 87 family protein [Agromyces sp. C10]|uniref:glycosyltransferase 87 family protein n=1 Tax=Agromyces sp. C10 TaxID=2935077 RepID=UPI00200AA8CE|nr:glycosyltransferase 87 family protein [Agromyces sp. C10]MCK8608304.1 glycosyltransferase 87 family protein [Agromyces sp. C10]
MTAAPAGTDVGRGARGGRGGGRVAAGRRLAVDLAFWVAVGLLAAANVVVLANGITTVRLWEDEAFNLTVPVNLVQGLGYTSDGTLSGSEPAPFDVRISTGPVMLLPMAGLIALGVDPVLAGRAVATLGYAGLLAALALVGHRLGGRWAALVAVAVPLAFETGAMPSPIQTPADILGEVTAAAFLAAALLFVHRRPWLAGLLLGLAIQVKFIALLAAPAFALAMLLDAPGPWGARLRRTIPRVLAAAGAAAVPTVLFELAKLVALGPAAYWQLLREFSWFLRSGGQQGYATSPLDKLATLAGSWNLPALLVALLAVVAVVAGAVVIVRARRRMPQPAAEYTTIVLAAGLALATFLAWWLVSRHTPAWVRHPAPAVLAFLPVLAAAVVPAVRVLLGARDRSAADEPAPRRVHPGGIAAAAASVIAVVVLAWSIGGRVAGVGTQSRPTGETLADQRTAARDIAEFGYDHVATVWGPAVSVGVLAGARVGLTDAVDVTADLPRIWFGEPPPRCDIRLQSGLYTVCVPE